MHVNQKSVIEQTLLRVTNYYDLG